MEILISLFFCRYIRKLVYYGMHRRAVSYFLSGMLLFFGTSGIFGFHFHHSAHETADAHIEFEESDHNKDADHKSAHCETHCQIEGLLEHLLDGAAIHVKNNTEASKSLTSSSYSVLKTQTDFSVSVSFDIIIYSLNRVQLTNYIQPNAPPFI